MEEEKEKEELMMKDDLLTCLLTPQLIKDFHAHHAISFE